jgi:hypothetical protein
MGGSLYGFLPFFWRFNSCTGEFQVLYTFFSRLRCPGRGIDRTSGQRAVQKGRGSTSRYPQITRPPLKNRIALFNCSESDAHSVCASGDYLAEGDDFRASRNDGDPDLRPGIQGSWGEHRAATCAQIASTG